MKCTKKFNLLIVLIIVIFSLSACNGSTEEIKVVLIGSTSVNAVAQPLADAFESKYENTTIEVQGGGSGTGITSAIEKTADIGMSSRELKDSEKGKGLVEHVIAIDGIAIVVHPSNTVSNLSIEQIQALFTGQITNWNQVGGADRPVVVVNREEGSGTRGAFEEILKIEGKVKQDIVNDSTGAVRTSVAGNENAIGYISAGSIQPSVKAVSVDNVECTMENIKSKSYKVSRPFLMLTNGEPEGNTRLFLDFVKSEDASKIISDKGFIPGGK